MYMYIRSAVVSMMRRHPCRCPLLLTHVFVKFFHQGIKKLAVLYLEAPSSHRRGFASQVQLYRDVLSLTVIFVATGNTPSRLGSCVPGSHWHVLQHWAQEQPGRQAFLPQVKSMCVWSLSGATYSLSRNNTQSSRLVEKDHGVGIRFLSSLINTDMTMTEFLSLFVLLIAINVVDSFQWENQLFFLDL